MFGFQIVAGRDYLREIADPKRRGLRQPAVMDTKIETRPQLPSPWIGHSNRDWAFGTRILLQAILDALDEAQLALKLFQDASKVVPQGDARLRRLYAKAFVFALDEASQFIRVLKEDPQLPDIARAQCARLGCAFPALRDLRNSLHHVEDRLRGLGLGNRPIPTSLLVVASLRDNNLGATTDKGTYVEMEVSDATLLRAFPIVKDLIWCFAWIRSDNSRILPPQVGP